MDFKKAYFRMVKLDKLSQSLDEGDPRKSNAEYELDELARNVNRKIADTYEQYDSLEVIESIPYMEKCYHKVNEILSRDPVEV